MPPFFPSHPSPLFCFHGIVAVAPMHPFHFLAVSRCQPHQTRRMKIEAGDRLIGFHVAQRTLSSVSFFAPRTSARLSDPQFCENATSTAIACPQRKSVRCKESLWRMKTAMKSIDPKTHSIGNFFKFDLGLIIQENPKTPMYKI